MSGSLHDKNHLTTDQVKVLAAYAGIPLPDDRLGSVVNRLRELNEKTTILKALPLGDAEPAAIFRADPEGSA